MVWRKSGMRVKRDLIQKIFMGVGIGTIKRELMGARTANKALLGTKFNEWYVERAK